MNTFGANQHEMRSLAKISERELDGILAGKANGGAFDDVAAFFREMRVGLDEALPARVQERHQIGRASV